MPLVYRSTDGSGVSESPAELQHVRDNKDPVFAPFIFLRIGYPTLNPNAARLPASETPITCSLADFHVIIALRSITALLLHTSHVILDTLTARGKSDLPTIRRGKAPALPHCNLLCPSVNQPKVLYLCDLQRLVHIQSPFNALPGSVQTRQRQWQASSRASTIGCCACSGTYLCLVIWFCKTAQVAVKLAKSSMYQRFSSSRA